MVATDSTGKVVSKTATYTIKAIDGVVITSMTSSVQSPQVTGTSIKINTKATSKNTVYYKYWINYNGIWTLLRNYSTTSSVTWTPKSSGSYVIWVDVKDSAGKTAYKLMNYEIKGKTTTYQETSSSIKYSGTWTAKTSSSYNGGSSKVGSANAKAQFTFTGTGITIYGTKQANFGYAKVTVDGVSKLVDLYSATTKYKQAIYTNSSLTNKSHTVTIEYVGMQNINATGNYISLDAIKTIS